VNSSRNERRRQKLLGRETGEQTKQVNPVGEVRSAELFPAQGIGKSDAGMIQPTALFSLNRRMRTRMSGGVRGSG